MLVDRLNNSRIREGEELKAPYYASAAAIRNSITTRDIVLTFINMVILYNKRNLISFST